MTDASHPHLERDLRAMTADGIAFSAMVGLGEAYVPAFALASGLGEVVAGLAATVPMLAGACLQMVTPAAVRRLGSYRRWVVLCARLQALSFVPLIVGAALGRVELSWVAVAAVAYWAFGMSTSPAWNAWVTSLVPREMRARFFARRARAAQAALLGGLIVAGLALEQGRTRGVELPVFAVLFGAAMTSRLISSGFLATQSEAPGLAASHRALGAAPLLERLRSAGSHPRRPSAPHPGGAPFGRGGAAADPRQRERRDPRSARAARGRGVESSLARTPPLPPRYRRESSISLIFLRIPSALSPEARDMSFSNLTASAANFFLRRAW